MKITVTKSNHSRVSEVDFANIPFGRVFSDHMFIADYKDNQWQDFRIVPFGHMTLHPSMLGLHYGQSIFEGMKATKLYDGTPVLFRPEMHAKRINKSAARMCMPEFPEDYYVEALHQLLAIDQEWIPKTEDSALYIRPLMYATDEFFGVKPSSTYRLIIFSGPVGPYYAKPVKLVTEQKYVRAVRGGAGEAKAAGNYGAALLATRLAQEKGFDQVMWLDAHEFKYVQEVGTMNLFFVVDGKAITPSTDGAILRGITRDSYIKILKDKGYQVEERLISMDELVDAWSKGKLEECFGAGTAALMAPVSHIQHGDISIELPAQSNWKIAPMLKSELNGIRSGRIADRFGWIVPIKVTEEMAV
jgi:branched-chain amino acid aminotransferase